ncbi:SRPBCC family protein [Sphingomonas immobilis]|uniref:SRPBCC family protein n=1 Tax=Sphingomonas immobilis TaxID=3063997 RepID=A0ABT8ZVI8_9SPHN|nr:SRPBCC family protein [Sphingomonas sp. CA1-15]MDO7841601.1 SRPBCC family protein [Sphingomonas sp. CA1-15]
MTLTQTAPDTIRVERLIDAPPETVWAYLVEDEKRGRWFAAGPLEPRVGGALTFTFDHDNLSANPVAYPEKYAASKGFVSHGTVTAFDPPRLLAFEGGTGSGEARFELTPEEGKTRLVIIHSGLLTRGDRTGTAAGWISHLDALAAVLAGGQLPDFWAAHAKSEAAAEAALPE